MRESMVIWKTLGGTMRDRYYITNGLTVPMPSQREFVEAGARYGMYLLKDGRLHHSAHDFVELESWMISEEVLLSSKRSSYFASIGEAHKFLEDLRYQLVDKPVKDCIHLYVDKASKEPVDQEVLEHIKMFASINYRVEYRPRLNPLGQFQDDLPKD